MDMKLFLAFILLIIIFIIWLLFNVVVFVRMRTTNKASKLYYQTQRQEDYDNYIDAYNDLIKTIKIDLLLSFLVFIFFIILFFIILH